MTEGRLGMTKRGRIRARTRARDARAAGNPQPAPCRNGHIDMRRPHEEHDKT